MTPISSSVKTCLVAAGRRTTSSTSAADGQPSAHWSQLRELATLYDAGHLRPVINKTFPFDHTLEALAYVGQGRATGKVVITLD